MALTCCCCTLILLAASAAIVVSALFAAVLRARRQKGVVAFFHPYCNAGGGGERVLWLAVQSVRQDFPSYKCFVYTGDEAKPDEILRRAHSSFGVSITTDDVKFVKLTLRNWVEANKWPVFTMLGQSLGSVLLGMEAILKLNPEVYVDSMGYAFTFPLFRWLGGCRVGAYVHYPTISTDMLRRAAAGGAAFNNRKLIARSKILTGGKLLYYRLFAKLYGFVGARAQVVMVNSSWTEGHIRSLWSGPLIHLVYPPCNVSPLLGMALQPRRNTILSIGQFRPEKNHALQVQSVAKLFELHPEARELPGLQLVICGGCRDDADRQRVEDLKKLAKDLGIGEFVALRPEIPFNELLELLQNSAIGVHTMWNEHFGIGVVELMAAGVIAVANNSGGPKMDIVPHPLDPTKQGTTLGTADGLLAVTAEEYARALWTVLSLTEEERKVLQSNARDAARRFSDEHFLQRFRLAMAPLLP